MGRPSFPVVAVVLAAFVGATLVGAASDYPVGLALGCGAVGAAFAAILNLSTRVVYLTRLLLIIGTSLGLGVVAVLARDRDLTVSAPFLGLALTVAIHLSAAMLVRRSTGDPGR